MIANFAPINQPFSDESGGLSSSWALWFNGVARATQTSGQAAVVASLPPAAKFPKGTSYFASNGRRAGEGPGAGSGVQVWSDGTVWRTFYDNSVVSA